MYKIRFAVVPKEEDRGDKPAAQNSEKQEKKDLLNKIKLKFPSYFGSSYFSFPQNCTMMLASSSLLSRQPASQQPMQLAAHFTGMARLKPPREPTTAMSR